VWLAVLVGDCEAVVGAFHPGGSGVEAGPQASGGGVVGEVANHVGGVGKVPLRVGREKRGVTEQRVPVHAEVELRVGAAGEPLVDGDQLTVAGKRAEERTWGRACLEDPVVTAGAIEEVAQL
jgi:hypothetical protein